MVNAPGDLLSAQTLQGHFHHDDLVGQDAAHIQNRAGCGQDHPEMLKVVLVSFSYDRHISTSLRFQLRRGHLL